MKRRDLLLGAATGALTLTACASLPEAREPQRFDMSLAIDHSRTLPLRVWAPMRGRGLPLVLFSHGAYSSGEDYDPLLAA